MPDRIVLADYFGLAVRLEVATANGTARLITTITTLATATDSQHPATPDVTAGGRRRRSVIGNNQINNIASTTTSAAPTIKPCLTQEPHP